MLSEIFTKKNIQILELVSKEELCIRDIAARLHCSPGKVHSAVQLFTKFNIIQQRKHKNMILIHINSKSAVWKHTKALIGYEKNK